LEEYILSKCGFVKCGTPWCGNTIQVLKGNVNRRKLYCIKCNEEHELAVLLLQTGYEVSIEELILEQAETFNFKSLRMISDALETRISSVRKWISKYFDCTWDEFRITYKCKNSDCEKIDTSTVKNKYYVVQKLKKERVCSCLTKDNSILVRLRNKEHIALLAELMGPVLNKEPEEGS